MSQIGFFAGSGGGGGGVNTLTGNTGVAGAVANNINVIGNLNVTTTGSGDTLTIDVAGTTNHSLQLGNSTGSLTSLGVATHGQIPIGSTGADPILATITAGTGISVSNGAGSITISASGTTNLTYTLVNTTPYTVLLSDDFLGVDCSGGVITVRLPNAPATGKVYIVKDKTGSSASNNITVTTPGGTVLIDGATTYVMNTAYQAIQVLFDGVGYQIF